MSSVVEMSDQLVTAIESLGAVLDRTLVWSVALVSSEVVIAISQHRKHPITQYTYIWFFSGMRSFVNTNVGFELSPELTFLA